MILYFGLDSDIHENIHPMESKDKMIEDYKAKGWIVMDEHRYPFGDPVVCSVILAKNNEQLVAWQGKMDRAREGGK